MKPVVFLINGVGGCGKDTFVSLCSKYTECANLSTIDPIKACARMLGWDGSKDEKSRKFLSDLKDMAEENFHTSYNYILDTLRGLDGIVDFVFIHCREPEQIELLKKDFNAITILIDASDRVPAILSNHADANVYDYDYDYIISNNESLTELEESAKLFINIFKK